MEHIYHEKVTMPAEFKDLLIESVRVYYVTIELANED